MNNIVEAPLVQAPRDDNYSTSPERIPWADYRAFSDETLAEVCALSLDIPKQKPAKNPLTRLKNEKKNRIKADKIVQRARVHDLKEAVLYARGDLQWDILQSES